MMDRLKPRGRVAPGEHSNPGGAYMTNHTHNPRGKHRIHFARSKPSRSKSARA